MKTRRSAIIKALVMFAGGVVGRRVQGQDIDHKDLVLADSTGTFSTIGISQSMQQSMHLRLELVDDKNAQGLDALEIAYQGKTLRLTAKEIWDALHD